MLLQKGAVNYCGCISRIEGAYIRIVGASAPTKRYKITPLPVRVTSCFADFYQQNGLTGIAATGAVLRLRSIIDLYEMT